MESEKPLNERRYKNAVEGAKVILREEGIRGFYKGFVAEIIRGGFSAVVPLIYTQIKLRLAA